MEYYKPSRTNNIQQPQKVNSSIANKSKPHDFNFNEKMSHYQNTRSDANTYLSQNASTCVGNFKSQSVKSSTIHEPTVVASVTPKVVCLLTKFLLFLS